MAMGVPPKKSDGFLFGGKNRRLRFEDFFSDDFRGGSPTISGKPQTVSGKNGELRGRQIATYGYIWVMLALFSVLRA